MDKRFEQFPPDSIRPDAPPDAEKPVEGFSQHPAALLRAEKQSHEASAPQDSTQEMREPSLDDLFRLAAEFPESIVAAPSAAPEPHRVPFDTKAMEALIAEFSHKATSAPALPQDDAEPLPSLEEIFHPSTGNNIGKVEAAPAHRPEVAEAPSAPEPPSQDGTGPLPSLEELFGSAQETHKPVSVEQSKAGRPSAPGAVRPARHKKLHNLLDALLVSQIPEEPEQAEAPERPDIPAPATAKAEAPCSAPPHAPALQEQAAQETEAPRSAFAPPDKEELRALLRDFAPPKRTAKISVTQASRSEPEPALKAKPIPAPDSIPEPDPAAAPKDSTKTTPPPVKQPLHSKTMSRKASGGKAMSLNELLAAAVPIEEAPPPQITPPQPAETPKAPARRRSRQHRKQTPHGDPAATAKAAAAAATSAEAPTGGAWTAQSAAGVAAAKAAATRRPARSQRPSHSSRKTPRNSDPVPSASVRNEASTSPRSTPVPTPPAPEKRPALRPEAAYRMYALPLDAIGARLILTGLFTIISLFFTLYLGQHWSFLPEVLSGGATVYIQLGLLWMILLTSRKQIHRKLRAARGLHPCLLLLLAAMFITMDCISAAKAVRSPFTVVFGALVMIFLWGEYDRALAFTTTVKVLRGDSPASGVSEVSQIAKGSRGLVRTTPDVARFMEKLETQDLSERVQRIFTPIAAISGLALTLFIGLGLKQDILWTGSLVFLGCIPTAGLLAFPRLYLLLSRRLAEADAALCGYHGAEVFGGEHALLIGDEDIFPAGSLTLNGFKIYNSNPDRIIAYAAAAARRAGSALDPVFDDLLVTHNGPIYNVDSFRFYDSGGIGASIGEDVVLMGSLDFMRRMGVHMDQGARVKQAVYLSLNGELAAVFAIRYAPPEKMHQGLASIAANRHFKGILVTRTFLGTPSFLKAKFGIPTGTFLYPSTSERIRLSEAELKRTGAQGAILAKDSFAGFAQAAAGGRMLRSATIGAAILTVLGGVSGLLLMSVLAALQAQETATALNLLLYVAVWLAPTLLLTVWGRHF